MVAYLIRRILAMILILLVGSFAIFGALYLAPGKPETFLVGGRSVSPAVLASIRAQYGLDDPFLVRYWDWLLKAVSGDFGQSLVSRQDVSTLLTSRLPTTTALTLMAAVLIIAFGVGFGVWAGAKGGIVDSAIVSVSGVGLGVPTFFAAAILTNLFAVRTQIFPVFGAGEGVGDRLWHLTLPSLALALPAAAVVARITRTAVMEERHSEHVVLATTRGLPWALVMRRHVLRNAMLPILTIVGVSIAGLVAGASVIEHAFTLNGVGALLVDAVQQKDFAVVQAVSLVLLLTFGVVNLVIDLLYASLDPRVQTQRATS